MISENTITTLISFLSLREGDPLQRKEYFDSFKEETVFVHFVKDFIPAHILDKASLEDLEKELGKPTENSEVDKLLSHFYKKNQLKREISSIATTIQYLILPSAHPFNKKISDDFIDVKLLQSLCKYQGRDYKATDQTLKAIGQKMGSNVLQPTNFWLEHLPFHYYHKELERYWQVAGSFKQYTWGKLFLPQHKDKKVFFNVGIHLKNKELFFGLDCLRAGTSKLSTEQILMFDHYVKDQNVMMTIPLDELGDMTWDKLIKMSSDFLLELEAKYMEIIDYIWYNQIDIDNIHHQLIRVKPDIHFFTKKGISTNGEAQDLAVNLVIDYERDSLEFSGKSSLAASIKSLISDDGSNIYDVHSFNNDGSDKYIKVIASENNSITGYQLRSMDIDESNKNSDKSFMYSVLNLSTTNKSGHLLINKGPFNNSVGLKPIIYTIE